MNQRFQYLCIVIALLMVITRLAIAAPTSTFVASQGETLINITAGKMLAEVKINTHEIHIGKPSDGRPNVIQSSCTYSKFPCSTVDRFDISVNGNPIFIPRSVFCDLADLSKAEIKADEMGGILTLYGGDASESYIARIEFDAMGVKRRTLSSAMSPDKLLQETIYHIQILGD